MLLLITFKEGAGNFFFFCWQTCVTCSRNVLHIEETLRHLSNKIMSSYKLTALIKMRMHSTVTPFKDTPPCFRKPGCVWGGGGGGNLKWGIKNGAVGYGAD
jgi:hypothetical protein